MRKKVLILGLCLLGVTHSLSSKDKKSIPLYKDAKAPIEKRIDDLISRMTLEENVFWKQENIILGYRIRK